MEIPGFEGREEALEKITRFSLYDVMFYRTDLLMHSQRVYWLVKDILPKAKEVYGEELDEDKVLALAVVHDDAEIITGDIQLADKLEMLEKEVAEVDANEAKAIEELAECWPKTFQNYDYRSLLYHVRDKDCLEAQLVSLADKLDAYCEALHEIYAGNGLFKDPVEVYTKLLGEFSTKFPLLARLLPSAHPLLEEAPTISIDTIIAHGAPHTKKSLMEDSGISQYERWKHLTIEHLGWEALTERKE